MTVPPPPGDTPTPPPGATPPPPPPPQPPGGMGMPPVPPPTSGGSNGTATAALICGIAGFFTCGIAGIVGVILGFSGRKKAQKMGGEGSGLATAGIILGIISIVLSIIGVVFLVLGAIATDDAIDDASKEWKKSVDEYEAAQDRNGEVAKTSHYKITNEEVEVGDYGYITYTAYIENKADFETDYTVEVECEGDLGDLDKQTTTAFSLDKGDRDKITLYYTFDEDTTSVECEVTEVVYGWD